MLQCHKFRSERAKGAEKASCGETVVQIGVFGESVFSSAPLRFALKTPENLRIHGDTIFALWTIVSLHDAFSAPLAHTHSKRRHWKGGVLHKVVRN